MPTKGPTLYRLAADRQYDAIPAYVRSHPEDLRWNDRYGSTALHILCQARSVDRPLLRAVDAILQHDDARSGAAAVEQVILQANVAGWTALHFAVEKRLVFHDNYSTALILRLVRRCPEAVSLRTQAGFRTKTPFHIACEADADYQVLKAMLTINPALATEPFVKRDVYSVAENPLQLLWKHNQYSYNGSSSRTMSSSRHAAAMRRTKEKMALLLQAAHYGTVGPLDRPFRLLNAATSVRCPRDYFSQVLAEHEHQVGTPDEAGLYPLHYAVMNANPDSQSYTQFVVEALLERYPDASAVPDRDGRLPLHIAVSDTLMTWHKSAVREIVFANPNALRRVDPGNGLVPFLASAVHATKSRLHLSTTFELLLAAPEMVQPWKKENREPRNTQPGSSRKVQKRKIMPTMKKAGISAKKTTTELVDDAEAEFRRVLIC